MTDVALLVLLANAAAGAPSSPVSVESATTCPTAAEVEARLRVLMPPAVEGVATKRARLAAEDGALRVHFAAADGTALGDRTVTVEASCADRANVVAVVIAAWEAQQRSEEVQAPLLPRPPAPPPAPAVVVTPTPAPARAPGPTIELVAGPAVTLTGGRLSSAAALALSVWGAGGRLGARVGLHGFAPRTESLGAGRARWTRAGVSVELGLRLAGRVGRLDAHGGVVAAVVAADGSGFDVTHQVTRLAPGLGAGVDASRAFGPLVVGLGAFGAAFNEQSLVDTTAAPVARALPRLQLSLDLHAGVAF